MANRQHRQRAGFINEASARRVGTDGRSAPAGVVARLQGQFSEMAQQPRLT